MFKKCNYCKKIYFTKKKKSKFCSRECSGKSKQKRITFKCDYCGNYKIIKQYDYNRNIKHFL